MQLNRWLWSVVHNCLIHPVMPFLPFAWVDRAHDWTGERAFSREADRAV